VRRLVRMSRYLSISAKYLVTTLHEGLSGTHAQSSSQHQVVAAVTMSELKAVLEVTTARPDRS